MKVDEPFRAPCGCLFETQTIDGVDTFIVVACALGERCQYVRYAMQESERQGKPPRVIGAS